MSSIFGKYRMMVVSKLFFIKYVNALRLTWLLKLFHIIFSLKWNTEKWFLMKINFRHPLFNRFYGIELPWELVIMNFIELSNLT